MPPEQELDLLKNQTQALREQLEQIETRMKELEASRAKSAARSER
jgi:prefoldin subunit 5